MDISVQWIAFPLHPETPEEGRTLEDMFSGRGIDIAQMLSALKRTADDLGLPLTTRSMTYNSRRAQELGKWAEEMGRGDAFHHAVFNAYFAQGHNIAQTDVLLEIAENSGLDIKAADNVLQQRPYKSHVDQDWQQCRSAGITAVPTFSFQGRYLVGAQPYQAIKNLIVSANVSLRKH